MLGLTQPMCLRVLFLPFHDGGEIRASLNSEGSYVLHTSSEPIQGPQGYEGAEQARQVVVIRGENTPLHTLEAELLSVDSMSR